MIKSLKLLFALVLIGIVTQNTLANADNTNDANNSAVSAKVDYPTCVAQSKNQCLDQKCNSSASTAVLRDCPDTCQAAAEQACKEHK